MGTGAEESACWFGAWGAVIVAHQVSPKPTLFSTPLIVVEEVRCRETRGHGVKTRPSVARHGARNAIIDRLHFVQKQAKFK